MHPALPPVASSAPCAPENPNPPDRGSKAANWLSYREPKIYPTKWERKLIFPTALWMGYVTYVSSGEGMKCMRHEFQGAASFVFWQWKIEMWIELQAPKKWLPTPAMEPPRFLALPLRIWRSTYTTLPGVKVSSKIMVLNLPFGSSFWASKFWKSHPPIWYLVRMYGNETAYLNYGWSFWVLHQTIWSAIPL